MDKKITGAQLLAECLVRHKIQYVFGIPGAKIDALFDAFLGMSIKVIVCRHEQNAIFLATACGRITGTPGMVLVNAGSEVSNLITGLLTATKEGDPVIAIGASAPRYRKDKQGVDHLKLTELVTKRSEEIGTVESIPQAIENAFRTAMTPQAGAVFLSIPQDVLQETTSLHCKDLALPITFGPGSEASLQQAAKLINEASNPVLLLGLEATRLENTKAIRSLLHKIPTAVVCTYQGAGVLSRDLTDCFVGRVGLFKNQPGDELLESADVIVTIGFSPSEYDPELWYTGKSKKIIHIHYLPPRVQSTYIPYTEVLGDIASNIRFLETKLAPKKTSAMPFLVKKLQTDLQMKFSKAASFNGEKIHPLRFLHDLRVFVDDDTTVISDVGTHYLWIARYFLSYQPHQLLCSHGQQTLGVALPWAMGASLVRPGKKVISISGDGSFLFSAAELETAVREKMHFIHFVWCDNAYNTVQEQQMIQCKGDAVVHFGSVDLVRFAMSFGAHAIRVTHSDQLFDTFKKALALTGPVIIEIPIDYSDNRELFESVKNGVIPFIR